MSSLWLEEARSRTELMEEKEVLERRKTLLKPESMMTICVHCVERFKPNIDCDLQMDFYSETIICFGVFSMKAKFLNLQQ